ncbi:MAG TPA: hypothetical protein PLB02_08845 [Thermoanaerobaculia bacterium]|nr:hypothetical protein [Thermoanaerobaculia bacterium]HQR67487.1 hypothetical protein [Thermoanaerobaculia bacterium]
MRKPWAVLKEETLKLVPPTIFFFVMLHVVMFVRVLMTKGSGLAPLSSVSIVVAALILGKAVLIADMLPIVNRFPEKPLIYNVSWKTVIYLVVATVIHYLERLVDVWKEAGGFVAANEELLRKIIWPHFWGIQIVLFLLILWYCMVHEMARVVGREKMIRIFFGPLPA